MVVISVASCRTGARVRASSVPGLDTSTGPETRQPSSPLISSPSKPARKCTSCKQFGHSKSTCPKKQPSSSGPSCSSSSQGGSQSEANGETSDAGDKEAEQIGELVAQVKSLHGVRAMREIILRRGKGKIKYCGQTHGAGRYLGGCSEEVPPGGEKMSPERMLVRHLATAIRAQCKSLTEVQVAFSHQSENIYVASNKVIRNTQKGNDTNALRDLLPPYKQSSMLDVLQKCLSNCGKDSMLEVLSKLLLPKLQYLRVDREATESDREKRHIRKLPADIDRYGNYTLVLVKSDDRSVDGEHAEAKIVDYLVGEGKDFSYIGGTLRPCLACSLYMKAKRIDQKKYNARSGPFWASKAALAPLVRMGIVGKRFIPDRLDETLTLKSLQDVDLDDQFPTDEDISGICYVNTRPGGQLDDTDSG
ncbi:hypothetical protein DIPPA_70222 [Diplonema papillatum]|nr:hypothetical protein DIPPA_70222 [Diplonema papillatum]